MTLSNHMVHSSGGHLVYASSGHIVRRTEWYDMYEYEYESNPGTWYGPMSWNGSLWAFYPGGSTVNMYKSGTDWLWRYSYGSPPPWYFGFKKTTGSDPAGVYTLDLGTHASSYITVQLRSGATLI